MTFANQEEARAWSVFFAAQCPSLTVSPYPDLEAEQAGRNADMMLEVWRERKKQKP